MLAELHHDPAAAHLVGDGAGGAGTGEGVDDKVARLGGDLYYALKKTLRLGSAKRFIAWK
jgi:hypothetical protein